MSCKAFATLFIFILLGCQKVNVESVYDRTSTIKLQKLSVVVTGPENYCKETLGNKIIEQLVILKPGSELHVIKKTNQQLTLDNENELDSLNKIITNSANDYILLLNIQTLTMLEPNNMPMHMELNCKILNKTNGKNIWKSRLVSTDGRSLTAGNFLDLFVQSLINQMTKDGLI